MPWEFEQQKYDKLALDKKHEDNLNELIVYHETKMTYQKTQNQFEIDIENAKKDNAINEVKKERDNTISEVKKE